MVSTRGIKLKFSENERVLCYEPDPTKAKVLYDSKVLDVVIRGRKNVEYLIHFQGWNSSWDRYVGEEYVLKDTPENRQLQKDLAEKSQLQLGAYLYRRDRKKQGRKISNTSSNNSDTNVQQQQQQPPIRLGGGGNGGPPSSEDGGSSGNSPTRMDTTPVSNSGSNNTGIATMLDEMAFEGGKGVEQGSLVGLSMSAINSTYGSGGNNSSSNEDDMEEDDDEDTSSLEADDVVIPIELPQQLKEFLEFDYDMINVKKRLVKLPAEPNIVGILENYWQFYSTNQINDLKEKPKQSRFPYNVNNTQPKRRPEDVQRNLNLCKEVLDGIRIYFDFTLSTVLLYKPEEGQVHTSQAVYDTQCLLKNNFDSGNRNNITDHYLNNSNSHNHNNGSDRNANNSSSFQNVSSHFHNLSSVSSLNDDDNNSMNHQQQSMTADVINKTSTPSERRRTLRSNYKVSADSPTQHSTNGGGGSTSNIHAQSSQQQQQQEVATSNAKQPSSSNNSTNHPTSTLNSNDLSTSSATKNNSPNVSNNNNNNNSTSIPHQIPHKDLLSSWKSWKLLPDHVYSQHPRPPSLIYGAIHLTRLFVKLPEMLGAVNPDGRKLKALLSHLDAFISFLNEHKEWFGEAAYMETQKEKKTENTN